MRTVILAVAIGMLIFLFSRHVLLVMVILYILQGLGARLIGFFRKRPELSDSNVEAKQT
jgi:hypothetical protein